MTEPLLQVKNLSTYFGDPKKDDTNLIKAVDGVSFDIYAGKTVGVVGESGSGKSTVGLSLLRLNSGKHATSTGEIIYNNKNILEMSTKELQALRGRDIAMVLQNLTALNPVFTIGDQIAEAISCHGKIPKKELLDRVIKSLQQVNIPAPEQRLSSHPHQLSGGMRQRVAGAMALACQPKLLIADEPTTALDVTVQALYLKLLKDIQEQTGIAILLITHDFGVVASVCDYVCVMYSGQIVEQGPVKTIFDQPAHWYTVGLLQSRPRLSANTGEKLVAIPGYPPKLDDLPAGCRFAERCPKADDRCRQTMPVNIELSKYPEQHTALCWHPRTTL